MQSHTVSCFHIFLFVNNLFFYRTCFTFGWIDLSHLCLFFVSRPTGPSWASPTPRHTKEASWRPIATSWSPPPVRNSWPRATHTRSRPRWQMTYLRWLFSHHASVNWSGFLSDHRRGSKWSDHARSRPHLPGKKHHGDPGQWSCC